MTFFQIGSQLRKVSAPGFQHLLPTNVGQQELSAVSTVPWKGCCRISDGGQNSHRLPDSFHDRVQNLHMSGTKYSA